MNNDLKPKIRFKGFTEDWKQLKLKELCNIFDGTHQTPNYKDNGIMFLSVENIKDLKSEKFISYDDFKNNFKIYPEKNDILMTRIGDIGTTNIVRENTLKAYYVSLALLKCRNINPYYLNSAIKSDSVQNGLKLRSLLTATPMKINKDQIGEVDINYPVDYKEQTNIGNMFDNLDSIITLHQCKYNKLVELKKSLLEKMFPQNNSKIPEIRFKGFTEDWEQRKLKDIGEILTGSTPSTSNEEYYSSDGILWVTPTDINSNIIKTTARRLSIKGEKVARIVPENTILVTCIASIGKNALVLEKSSFNQQINSLTPFDKYNPYFLLTDSVLWSNTMKQQGAAGMMQIVNKNEFSEIETNIPSEEEQNKIGNLYKQIDNLITLHQRKHDKLNKIKQSLLNDMFV